MNTGVHVLRRGSLRPSGLYLTRGPLPRTACALGKSIASEQSAPAYREGQEVEAECFRLAHDSQGVCLLGPTGNAPDDIAEQHAATAGMVTFVANAVPGERVRLKLTRVWAALCTTCPPDT